MKEMRLWSFTSIMLTNSSCNQFHKRRLVSLCDALRGFEETPEEADSGDCREKIGGLKEGETVDGNLSLFQKLSKQIKRDNVMLTAPQITFYNYKIRIFNFFSKFCRLGLGIK